MKTLKNFYNNFKSDPDKYLLVLLVFLLPFERIPSVDIASVSVRPSLVLAGIIIVRAVYLLSRKRIKLQLLTPQKILIIFLVWLVLLIPEAINIKRSIAVVVFNGFTIATAFSVGLLFKKQYIKPLLTSLFASAIFVCVIGLLQYPADLLGVAAKYTGLLERYRTEVFGFPRIQSTALEPLYFASYLMLPISAALVLLLRKTQNIYKKTKWLWGLLLLFSFTVFMTVSRGGAFGLIAAFVFAVIVLGWLQLTSWKKIGLTLVVLVAGFVLTFATISVLNKTTLKLGLDKGKNTGGQFTSHLQDTGTESNGDERSVSRQKAINILKMNHIAVVIGIGPGQYGPYIQNNVPMPEGGWQIVNNLTLELLVETGVVGLCTILAFFTVLAWKLLVVHKNTKDKNVQVFALIIVTFLVAEAVQYQSFSTLYIMQIWVATGLGLGLLVFLPKSKKSKKR